MLRSSVITVAKRPWWPVLVVVTAAACGTTDDGGAGSSEAAGGAGTVGNSSGAGTPGNTSGNSGSGSSTGAGNGNASSGNGTGSSASAGSTGSGGASTTGTGSGGSNPPPPAGEPLEGFGTMTPGGEGGQEIHVTDATDKAVRDAFNAAGAGHVTIIFDVAGPIAIQSPLPLLDGAFITIEGNCVTLDGSAIAATAAMVDVRGHDIIVRNMRLRNGGDNLRAQTAGAYNVVFAHVSSTGAADDGISIGYGAHDVTVQYSFLAGNTRSMFIKYNGSTNVTLHHSWLMKQWIRGPLMNAALVDVRNVIVQDWTLWGTRFEEGGHGNAVGSLWRLSPFASSLGGKNDATLYPYMGSTASDIYADDNAYEGDAVPSPALNGSATQPFAAPPVTTHPQAQMVGIVEAKAGCLPRDGVDQAYINASNGWTVKDGNPFRNP